MYIIVAAYKWRKKNMLRRLSLKSWCPDHVCTWTRWTAAHPHLHTSRTHNCTIVFVLFSCTIRFNSQNHLTTRRSVWSQVSTTIFNKMRKCLFIKIVVFFFFRICVVVLVNAPKSLCCNRKPIYGSFCIGHSFAHAWRMYAHFYLFYLHLTKSQVVRLPAISQNVDAPISNVRIQQTTIVQPSHCYNVDTYTSCSRKTISYVYIHRTNRKHVDFFPFLSSFASSSLWLTLDK